MWSTKSIHGSTNLTYLLTGGTCTYTWFRKPYWNYITSVVLFSFHSSPLARTKQQETAYLLNIRNTTRVTFSIAMHHLMLKVWQVCPWSFESWGSGSGMGQTSWHIWDIFLVSVVLVTIMSSWVWVIIFVLVGGVGCHIILTKSDRTIIYEPDESSYKPTPIPLTPTVQVCVQWNFPFN